MNIVNLDYQYVKVNNKMCQMLGYTEQELTGLTFLDITHPEDIDKAVKHAQQAFRGEIPYYRIEKRYIKKNGEIVWVDVTGSIIRDKNGNPLYGIAMIEDITELKKAEEERLKIEADKQRVEELEKFARVAVGRELKMIELKKRIKELEKKLKAS